MARKTKNVVTNLLMLMLDIDKLNEYYQKEVFESTLNFIEEDQLYVSDFLKCFQNVNVKKLKFNVLQLFEYCYDSRFASLKFENDLILNCREIKNILNEKIPSFKNQVFAKNDSAVFSLNDVLFLNGDKSDLKNLSDEAKNIKLIYYINSFKNDKNLQFLFGNKLVNNDEFRKYIKREFRYSNVWNYFVNENAIKEYSVFKVLFKEFKEDLKESNICLTNKFLLNRAFVSHDFDFYKENVLPLEREKISLIQILTHKDFDHKLMFCKNLVNEIKPTEEEKLKLWKDMKELGNGQTERLLVELDLNWFPDFNNLSLEDKIDYFSKLILQTLYVEPKFDVMCKWLKEKNLFSEEFFNKKFMSEKSEINITSMAVEKKLKNLFKIALDYNADLNVVIGKKTIEKKLSDNQSIKKALKELYDFYVLNKSLKSTTESKRIKV